LYCIPFAAVCPDYLKGKENLGDLGMDMRINRPLKKYGLRMRTALMG
jgi:hypothetical protein